MWHAPSSTVHANNVNELIGRSLIARPWKLKAHYHGIRLSAPDYNVEEQNAFYQD